MNTLLLLLSCAASIAPQGDDTGGASQVAAGEAVIDATSETDWVYLDLGGGQVVRPADPDDSAEWDLGFRRYKVKINGGISGTADMAVVPFFETPYSTELEAPTEGWVTDQADADADGDPEYALDTWFAYDADTHQVTPADVIYVVRDAASDLAKLQFLAYYDDAGSPGYIHLRWGALAEQGGTDTGGTTKVPFSCGADASSLSNTDLGGGVTLTRLYTGDVKSWMCWSFASAGLVTEGWDLAMQKWDFRAGESLIAVLPGQDFGSLSQAPTEGWLSDTEDDKVMEDWYLYNTTEHTLDPDDIVYVIHTAAGGYYKLQLVSYYPDGDTEQPHWPSFQWAAIAAPKG